MPAGKSSGSANVVSYSQTGDCTLHVIAQILEAWQPVRMSGIWDAGHRFPLPSTYVVNSLSCLLEHDSGNYLSIARLEWAM